MPPRLPPLNSLRAFEAAARLLSFKQAAEELSVTPTAISHQIKLLEEFLDLRLFRRLTRSLELTDEGSAMLPKVQEGFASLAAAIEASRRLESGGIVTMCAPPSFAARWLVPRLAVFHRAHPDIDLHLSSSAATIDGRERDSPGDLRPGAGEAPYDLTVRFGRGQYAGQIVDQLFTPAYVPVCSPTLLEGERPLREPGDLRWQVLIHDSTVPELEDRPGWATWLELAGAGDLVGLVRGVYFEDGALAVASAMAGHGVALAARPLISADVAAGRLAIPFPQSIPSRYAYYVATPAATAERPTVLALRTWLAREAARERAQNAPHKSRGTRKGPPSRKSTA